MSVLSTRPGFRWLVPAAAALAVIGGGVAIGAITAAADQRLAPRSAADLLVDLQTARLDGMSGTVVLRSDLGLPALPGVGGRGSADLTSLISGTHTLRVWYAGPEQVRVALLGTLGETDVIRNGRDMWIWESRENRATHRTLPADAGGDKGGTGDRSGLPLLPSNLPFTPQQLADVALAALQPTTEVTTDGSARVAGRDAHELVLAPKDKDSLVGSIRLAIDATEHVPLRVQVFARDGGDPALEIAFTQISFARPDPEQFRFNPPPGATVTEETGDTGPKPSGDKPDGDKPDGDKPDGDKPGVKDPAKEDPPAASRGFTVVGSAWTSVLVARVPEAPTGEPSAPGAGGGADPGNQLRALLEQLPRVNGSWGSGRMLSSRLVTVLLTDDGRILVGAVTADRIMQAAADPAAQLPR